MQRRANETSDARKLWLEKKPKRDKQRTASETNDARKLHLQKSQKLIKNIGPMKLMMLGSFV